MQVIPVIDFQAGKVVRAIGGRRAEYRPLTSRLTNATDPLGVANAIRERYGFTEFYFADLDAIAGAMPAWDTYRSLRDNGFRVWVDAGVRTTQQAISLYSHVDAVVLGLETLDGPQVLDDLTQSNPVGLEDSAHPTTPSDRRVGRVFEAHRARLVFSLDLRNGRSLGSTAWGDNPFAIADRAIAAGINRMIVLDLAYVGGTSGLGTEAICGQLASRVEVFAGGGVRNGDDLRRLEGIGVAGVLVASAIHDGVNFD